LAFHASYRSRNTKPIMNASRKAFHIYLPPMRPPSEDGFLLSKKSQQYRELFTGISSLPFQAIKCSSPHFCGPATYSHLSQLLPPSGTAIPTLWLDGYCGRLIASPRSSVLMSCASADGLAREVVSPLKRYSIHPRRRLVSRVSRGSH